ncbi:MAG: Gfo/Idh/MocA family oxidoreductase [Ruminococcaceae bacterium]|nr:Gfo/Idh/MocA family oxidoreductase [Oscillospiraceae bacterium]
MKKMKIAIIGQGRSGRNIHGRFFKSTDNDFCEVVCIVESDEERKAKAALEFGCDTLSDYTELYDRKDIDLVVNASYSQMHYEITKNLLKHGFNVLSEKPFGRSYYECMDLVHTAKQNNVVVAAFHQSLYSPAFLNVKDIIASGKIGDVIQINLKYSGFARRWDWQTLQSCCAGGVYNTGPHPIGQALDLLGWDKNTKVAFSSLKTILTSGDSDDYGKIILTTPGKPAVDIEVISADAFASDYVFKIFGTKGTLISTNQDYKLKYIEDFSQYPERPVIRKSLSDDSGNPVYCSEKLNFIEEQNKISGSSFDVAVKKFYQMMYNSIFYGEALDITPEHAAQVIGIIEACHAENPLPIRFD